MLVFFILKKHLPFDGGEQWSPALFKKESLPVAGGWNEVIFKDPSNPNLNSFLLEA